MELCKKVVGEATHLEFVHGFDLGDHPCDSLILRVVDCCLFFAGGFLVVFDAVSIFISNLRAVHLTASHITGSGVILVLLSGYFDLLRYLIGVFSVHLKLIWILK